MPTLPVFIAIALLFGHADSAHAYIDPNAGGTLFQLLTPVFAALLGGWVLLRRYIGDMVKRGWTRVRQWMGLVREE